jgi:hypothetical protein
MRAVLPTASLRLHCWTRTWRAGSAARHDRAAEVSCHLRAWMPASSAARVRTLRSLNLTAAHSRTWVPWKSMWGVEER